ncbi:transmembrane protein 276 [Rhinophrynus dorsalis]
MAAAHTDCALVLSHISLCIVSLLSAVRTFQVHRASASGFLIHGLNSALHISAFLLQGLTSVLPTSGSLPPLPYTGNDPFQISGNWAATVIGLPLLAFAFFWLNGDQSSANVLLGAALLLAAGSGYMTMESQRLAACTASAAASLSILVVSIFTGSGYGVLGSLGLGIVELLSSVKAEKMMFLRPEVASNCVLATGFLALQISLRNHESDSL